MVTLYDSVLSEGISTDAKFNETAQLLVALGRSLHQVGLSSHKVEHILIQIAERFHVPLQVFAMPTGQFLSFYREDGPWTYVLRVPPGVVHLDRLSQLMVVADRLIDGSITPLAAKARIDKTMQETGRPGKFTIVMGYVLSAAAFAVFFQGGLSEVAVAICVGLVVGLLSVFMRKFRHPQRLFELLAATSAALIAGVADQFLGAYSGWIPLAAGLIILLPGLALVDALDELANGHLMGGAGRLAGVGVVFLALTFGVVLGFAITSFLPVIENVQPKTLNEYAVIPALVAVSIGSTIRFRARAADWLIILAASAVALAGSRFGRACMSDFMAGPFLGSLSLGIMANLYSHWSHRPAELLEVPGLALLVPGSVGYKSLESLLNEDTQVGVDAAFHMFMIGIALVAGLLFSDALFRQRWQH